MSEPFVGEIRMFAGNFAPRGWAFCDGQLMAVSQNDALFSLLGTVLVVMVVPRLDCPICVVVFRCIRGKAQVFLCVALALATVKKM
ncbi:phage tail protein [Thalassolituus oleivorans]|uniref:phage tail protein n=1 Tax=Thalassolituus oleivorans TaxID=187493 RepID=UPI003B967900